MPPIPERFELGANVDTRPTKERDKDYKAEEVRLFAGAPVPYQHKRPKTVGATQYGQEYTSSCVPHGFYTQLEYEKIVPLGGLSQLRAYRKRLNYPYPGSQAVDMYTQIKDGQSVNSDAPVTPMMGEAAANAMPRVVGVKLLKDFNYFEITNRPDAAQYVAAGKAVAIFVFATEAEWSREYVKIIDPNLKIEDAYVRHCVCLIPEGDFTENGKKWLAVHDSSKFGGRYLRYIPAEWLEKRTYYASYVLPKDAVVPTPVPPPTSDPRVPCYLNDKGQAVLNLQAFLVKRGYLESKYQTGLYGPLTAKAVLWYQLANWQKFTSTIPALLELRGEAWGPQSINSLDK